MKIGWNRALFSMIKLNWRHFTNLPLLYTYKLRVNWSFLFKLFYARKLVKSNTPQESLLVLIMAKMWLVLLLLSHASQTTEWRVTVTPQGHVNKMERGAERNQDVLVWFIAENHVFFYFFWCLASFKHYFTRLSISPTCRIAQVRYINIHTVWTTTKRLWAREGWRWGVRREIQSLFPLSLSRTFSDFNINKYWNVTTRASWLYLNMKISELVYCSTRLIHWKFVSICSSKIWISCINITYIDISPYSSGLPSTLVIGLIA